MGRGIRNISKNRTIAACPVFANSLLARGRGMIGRRFDKFDAMVFQNCDTIHTMFMGMRIDVLFVDEGNRVCAIKRELRPWLPWVSCPAAAAVIEMPGGNIEHTGTEVGDVLDLNAETIGNEKRGRVEEAIIAPANAVPRKGEVRCPESS